MQQLALRLARRPLLVRSGEHAAQAVGDAGFARLAARVHDRPELDVRTFIEDGLQHTKTQLDAWIASASRRATPAADTPAVGASRALLAGRLDGMLRVAREMILRGRTERLLVLSVYRRRALCRTAGVRSSHVRMLRDAFMYNHMLHREMRRRARAREFVPRTWAEAAFVFPHAFRYSKVSSRIVPLPRMTQAAMHLVGSGA